MNNAQIKKLIEEGFNKLYPLTHWTFTDHRAAMLDYELKVQKQFRATCPHTPKWQHTNQTVAKYFVIHAVKQALAFDTFRPRDILHCKQSYIIAQALKDHDADKFREMVIDFDWDAFESIEYSQADLSFRSTEEAA